MSTYQEYFNLKAAPFQLTPDQRFFFDSRVHRRALSYLRYGLFQREGFVVITGEVGAGKTTLINYLLARVDSTRYVTANVVTSQVAPDDLLKIIASEYRLTFDRNDKSHILGEITNFLRHACDNNLRPILLIDEAQNLSTSGLEELRMLSNLQVGERQLLQIYLVGQPEFRQILAQPILEQLRQRVIVAHHLPPLDALDTRRYIEHRLKLAGWNNNPPFSDDSFDLIHAESSGKPRRINLLCDRIFLFAYLEGRKEIGRDVVQEVLEDIRAEGLLGDVRSKNGTLEDYHLPGSRPAGAEHMASGRFGKVVYDDPSFSLELLEIEQRLEVALNRLRGLRAKLRSQDVNFLGSGGDNGTL